jgi:hypothetical protein
VLALLLRQEGEREDYDVMNGKLVVGRIHRPMRSPPDAESWAWSITGVQAELGVMVSNGTSRSLDEAKAELMKNWRKWLTWAELTEKTVT